MKPVSLVVIRLDLEEIGIEANLIWYQKMRNFCRKTRPKCLCMVSPIGHNHDRAGAASLWSHIDR